jgi:elongation factor G
VVFEDRIKGGAIPREFVKGVESGVRAAATEGLQDPRLRGFPVVDVKVVLHDGATHVKDSSELAFHIAGMFAFRQACMDALPVALEPLMLLEVSCLEEHIGAVVGDISKRRGQVMGIDARVDERVVRAELPLAESFGYAGELGGLTHGRGRFTMEPSRYEQVPQK